MKKIEKTKRLKREKQKEKRKTERKEEIFAVIFLPLAVARAQSAARRRELKSKQDADFAGEPTTTFI